MGKKADFNQIRRLLSGFQLVLDGRLRRDVASWGGFNGRSVVYVRTPGQTGTALSYIRSSREYEFGTDQTHESLLGPQQLADPACYPRVLLQDCIPFQGWLRRTACLSGCSRLDGGDFVHEPERHLGIRPRVVDGCGGEHPCDRIKFEQGRVEMLLQVPDRRATSLPWRRGEVTADSSTMIARRRRTVRSSSLACGVDGGWDDERVDIRS